MKKNRTNKKLNHTHRPLHYTALSLSTGMIASLLLTLTPNTLVSAETNAGNVEKEHIEHLYQEFHTIIQTNKNLTEETQYDTPQLVSENEDIRLIKDNLLTAFEKMSSTELADQLRSANLTLKQLDVIFEQAVTMLLDVEEAQNEGRIEAMDIPDATNSTEEPTDEIKEEAIPNEEASEILQPVEQIEEIDQDQEQNKRKHLNLNSSSITQAEKTATANVQTVRATVSSNNPAEKNSASTTYIVKAGDTLDSIARKHQTTAKNLAALNKISNPNLIFVGQTLTVSGTLQNQENTLEELNTTLTSSEFIEVVGEQARVVAGDHNLYASVMIAQAALESGYGKSSLSSVPNHNLFGIKGSYNGESVTMKTSEYSNATGWITIYDAFKKYPSYTESLLDNARLLRNGLTWNPAFYAGTWIENTTSYKDATAWLEGRYATDPTYSTKLNNIIANYNLTRFDLTPNGDVVVKPAPSPKPAEKPVTPSSSINSYTVKAGDNLTKISRAYNMTVAELKKLNGLHSDLIFVGQSLKVNAQPAAPTPAPKPTQTPQPAPKPVEKPSSPQTNNGTYKVKAGDTLSHIASANKMSVSALKQLNNLSSDLIFVGQTLKVSAAETVSTPKPAPKPEAKPATSTATGTYRVKAGDTLSHIASANKMSVSTLKQLNNLSSDLIFVGQTLKVSASEKMSTPKPAPKPEAKPATSQTTRTYTVKAGDTLSHIARANKMSVRELKQLNNLSSDLIFVGQTLKIRNETKSSTVTTNTVSSQADKKVVTPSSSSGLYTVKAGDTLSHISRTYKMSVSALKKLNNLNSDLIFVGQRLKVANQAKKAVSSSNRSHATANQSHRVVSGDTLSGIARRYGMTVRSLKEKNRLNSDLIIVGQVLNI